MGFLDNSGDIILDAVLTDLGRKKMADGNFRITKFAVGDDEIDYGLYNKNSASGSAYYDLEILQTPIFEAFTQTNAGINYGLLTNTATDILYLPVLDINKKGISNTVSVAPSVPNLYHISSTANGTAAALETTLGAVNYFALSANSSGPAILLEAGLNTDDINGTTANRSTYLVANNLVDNYFYVYYDSRFINSILGPRPGASFENTTNGDGNPTLTYALRAAPSISTDLQLENYTAARINAFPDGVVYNQSDGIQDTSTSQIEGPRSSFTVLNVEINSNLSTQYAKYGTEGGALPGAVAGSSTYDYLDTVIFVQGTRTGIQLQIPLRIVTLNTL